MKHNLMDLEFKKLDAESTFYLTKFYEKRDDRTCDSEITSNFLWSDFYNVRYCVCDDEALLWLVDVDGKLYATLPVCGLELLPKYLNVLEHYFNEELRQPLEIYWADEEAVEYLDLPKDRYTVTELADSRDYLYSAEALRTLSGRKLHKKKNHLNSFLKEYEGRYEYRTLNCGNRKNVWDFLDKWRKQKGQEVEVHLDYELNGIHKVLMNCWAVRARMGGVFIDGEMEAFSLGSYNSREKMAIIHIEKANPDIVGLYQFINQQFLIHEFPGAEIVNREDDMGLPGLRQAKMSYAPMDFARKFKIEQRPRET